jgi:hypothetical protein
LQKIGQTVSMAKLFSNKTENSLSQKVDEIDDVSDDRLILSLTREKKSRLLKSEKTVLKLTGYWILYSSLYPME